VIVIRLKQIISDKTILYQNTFDPQSLQNWLNVLDEGKHTSSQLASLDIDYDIYAEGEAKLAWLDQSLEVLGKNAQQGAEYLIREIYQQTQAQGYPIGHLKFLVNGKNKVSFTAQSQAAVHLPDLPESSVNILLNIRVQSSPEAILHLINEACKTVEAQRDFKILLHRQSAFQPGYPEPVHRMP